MTTTEAMRSDRTKVGALLHYITLFRCQMEILMGFEIPIRPESGKGENARALQPQPH